MATALERARATAVPDSILFGGSRASATPRARVRQRIRVARGVDYGAYLESRYSAAEAATRGNLVSAQGRRQGISANQFFTGKPRSLKYASEELKDWFPRQRGQPDRSAVQVAGHVVRATGLVPCRGPLLWLLIHPPDMGTPDPVMGGSTMAGVGPAPKDPSKRARRNAQPEQTVLPFSQCDQPDLPDGFPWPDATREWWQMWRSAPQSTLFGVTDWNFLLDTALIHADVWGNWNLDRMPELRIRVAKFGATPEDRARLRVTFAEADEKDAKRPAAGTSSRQRYGVLKALPSAVSE